jgi:H+/Cl- antiporter ClcA
MAAATLLTGAAAGAFGIALTLLLHLVQHLAFGYTENTFLVGVQRASGPRRVRALTAGGLVVGTAWWVQRRRVPQHAVSVTAALRQARPRLPFVATIADAVLQLIAVGAGASLGREGAPRQAGAASGGWIAAGLKVTPAQQRTLVAAGAGAGLAAVYNVPLGGTAFTLEVLLGSIALAEVVPAVVCAAVATVLAWPVLGNQPTYRIPSVGAVGIDPPVLCWAVVLGPVAGVAGVLFTGLMTTARLHAPTGPRSVATITAVFAGLGALAIGYPQLLGNGRGLAALAFDGSVGLGLAGLLMVLKPLATAACLGAGAIGGLLTPSLATGAALGLFTGRLWSMLWPGAPLVAYAVVGAAALLAVTLHAPVTAVVLTLEFVGTAQALLAPMLLAVALASATASVLRRNRPPGRRGSL